MDHYIDIQILPNGEISQNIILGHLYTKLHKKLFDINSQSIGVSFPKYKITLGDVLRLHGNKENLTKLDNWQGSMIDHCRQSQMLPIPTNTKHRIVSRIRPLRSQAKLRRLIKRGTIDEDGIKNYYTSMLEAGIDKPYIQMASHSNGNKHRRYIEHGVILNEAMSGDFDNFGMSKIATIPWFDNR